MLVVLDGGQQSSELLSVLRLFICHCSFDFPLVDPTEKSSKLPHGFIEHRQELVGLELKLALKLVNTLKL